MFIYISVHWQQIIIKASFVEYPMKLVSILVSQDYGISINISASGFQKNPG